MKILWLCGLPKSIQEEVLNGKNYGAGSTWSWVVGHLPAPKEVDLHIACPVTKGPWKNQSFNYKGATFHLVRVIPGRRQTAYIFDPFYMIPLKIELNPDIIHGWGTESSFSLTAQLISKNKHIVQVQGLVNAYLKYLEDWPGKKWIAYQERRTLKKAKHVFVEGEYSKEITLPFCGQKTKIHIVDHPLRSDFLKGSISSKRLKNIIYIGSICDRKGYLDAIEAFKISRLKDWKLIMFGSGNIEDESLLKNSIADNNMVDSVTWHKSAGPDKIVEYMKSSAVFMLPTSMDTGPTALKEALAMGLWPIVYDNTGPRELLKRFNYGWSAPTGNRKELANLLVKADVERPWEDHDRMENLVNEVRYALSSQKIWDDLIKIYTNISHDNKSR